MGTTSYSRVLESVVREELGVEPGDLGLKFAIAGGDSGMEDPEFRARIEQVWGMRAQNIFGISDILCTFGAVCDHGHEIHYQCADAMIPQLVNPETGDPLAIEEGVVGELVGTSINKEAQPLLRRRTRDVLEITGTGSYRCGRTGFRFRMIGRDALALDPVFRPSRLQYPIEERLRRRPLDRFGPIDPAVGVFNSRGDFECHD
jgi:phenylacetate-CoA ligase